MGQNTDKVPLYDVLMDQIKQIRADVKDIEKKAESRVKEGDCRGHRKDVFQKIRDTREYIDNIDAALGDRLESVEEAQKEASAMTSAQVELAVEQGIKKANGHSYFPKTLRETLQSILFVCLLLGMVYTVYDHFASDRVEQKQLEKIVERLNQAVPAVPAPTP